MALINEFVLDGESKYYDVWHWIPIALMLFEVFCCFKAERAVTYAIELTKACQQGCSSHTGMLRSSVALSSGTQHSASFFLMFIQIKKHFFICVNMRTHQVLTLLGSC